MKKCCRCKKKSNDYCKDKSRKDGLAAYCKPCSRILQALKWKEKRLSLLSGLGGKCVWCGCDDIRVLQVDHIKGGGQKERNSHSGSRRLSIQLQRINSGDYQLLCSNCNWIKKFENEET